MRQPLTTDPAHDRCNEHKTVGELEPPIVSDKSR